MQRLIITFALIVLSSAAIAAPTASHRLVVRHRVMQRATMRYAARPHIYTKHKLAITVQKLMDLPNPPLVGPSVTLEPDHLALPGVAEMSLSYVQGIAYNQALLEIAGGGGNGITESSIGIGFQGKAGKHYVIDCRASPVSFPLTYAITLSGGTKEGTVQQGNDGHFVFITNAIPKDESVGIAMWPKSATPQPDMRFFGCDISPF